MEKMTTAQVAKALDMTKQKIYTILQHYPDLRPGEQGGPMVHHLWSEAEIAALQAHLAAHPRIKKLRKQAPGL